MATIIDRMPLMSDEELRTLQKNAMDVVSRKTGKACADAEIVLAATEEEFARRHLPGAIARFKEEFSAAFNDPDYLAQERKEKDAAAAYCKAHLSREAFRNAVTPQDSDALLLAVRRLVAMTNLLQGSFEKPKLLDKISEPDVTRGFLAALETLMWGSDPPERRIVQFCERTSDWGLGKWVYATYFLFFAHPDSCMFVKPESMRRALDRSPYPLTYDSTVTAELYRGILDFSAWLRNRLADLGPKDMIDVQSFIWYMAPTGKWEK